MAVQFQLTNPANRSEFFKLVSLKATKDVQRLEGYTILLIIQGSGKILVSDGAYDFSNNSMLCLSPYEPFRLLHKAEGYQLTFHPDFLCVYKHHAEVACNGVLFDNLYDPPLFAFEGGDMKRLLMIIDQMKNEFGSTGLARQEALISLLKIFLIHATRIKVGLFPSNAKRLDDKEPLVLLKLRSALEKHYRELHTAGSYAELLHLSTKALSRLTRTHFNRKLSDLIADRILMEAKRELYLTSKTIKEIAYSLGFKDEFYFSRFFKNKVKVSPQRYRETMGYAKMEMASL